MGNKKGYLTREGNLKLQTVKSLLTKANELWKTINIIAEECGLERSEFLLSPKEIKVVSIFSPADIVYKVNTKFGVNVKTGNRKIEVVLARFAVCYLLRKFTKLSLKEIASYTAYHEHTSVINAKDSCIKRMEIDHFFKQRMQELITEIENDLSSDNKKAIDANLQLQNAV